MKTPAKTTSRLGKVGSKSTLPDIAPTHFLQVRDWLAPRKSEMVAGLKELVLLESPTHDKAACDQLCGVLADKFLELGGRVKVHRQKKAGDHLQVDFGGSGAANPSCCWAITTPSTTWARSRRCRGVKARDWSTGPASST